jgi:Leucine-rich repeat (LRR) protein
MKKFCLLLSLVCLFLNSKGNNAPAPSPNYVCVGVSSLLSDITIDEVNPADFLVNGSGTIVLEASSGSFAITGSETVLISGSASLSASLVVTSSQVIITLTESNNDNGNELNSLTIQGIYYTASSATEESIYYASASTVEINGLFPDSSPVSYVIGNSLPSGFNDSFIECSYATLFYDLDNNVNTLGNGVPSSFNWQAQDNGAVTGEATTITSGGYINDMLTNESGVIQNVLYTVTPTSMAAGCTGDSFTVTVTINPAPVLTITNNSPKISSGGTTDISISSSLVSTTFNFNAESPAEITGTGEGTGTLIAQTLTNSGGPAQKVSYFITGMSTDGCSSLPSTALVTVNGFASVDVADSLALVAFFNSTNGNGWESKWLDGSVDTWYGVTVSGFRVTGIELITNGVTGVLPTQLGDLTELTILSIAGSKGGGGITGSLPPSISNLVNLAHFELSGNTIATLPPELFTLTNLTHIILRDNRLTGVIPSGFNNLVNLVFLNLSDNNFSGTVPDLSNIIGPVEINLQENELTATTDPSSWNLTLLDLSENQLTFEDLEPLISVPNLNYTPQKPFGVMVERKQGSGETFTASFSTGGSANNYQWMKGDEMIPGATSPSISIPDLTTENTNRYSLRVTNNIVTSLTMYSAPIFLTVSSTYTPDSLAAVAFYIATGGAGWVNHTNWVAGPLETWFGLTVSGGRITEMNLPDNKLKGTLPVATGDLTELTYLDLGGDVFDGKTTNPDRNAMVGNIPDAIGNLTNLYYLNLSSNDLSGNLPVTFSNLVNLTELSLSGNSLTVGSFPTAVLSMSLLQSLKLSFCGITGAIPSGISSLASLQALVLNNNKITDVPIDINALTNLSLLHLNNNAIVDLPDLNGLSALSDGHVERNQLTFEDLESNFALPLIYIPQDSLGIKSSVLFETSTPGILTSSVGGTANQYKWKKNNVEIPGETATSFTLPTPDFTDEGIYLYEVTSTIVPGLTLIARPINVKVSSLKRDSLALVQLYTATNGSVWNNRTGWLSGKLSTWNGVTVTANRVTNLNLTSNNLHGPIPSDLSDIVNLKTVNVSNNKINKLPVLTPLTQLTAFNASENHLDFTSLEANQSMLGVINYTNQAALGVATQDSVIVPASAVVRTMTGGINNLYQWKRNNVSIPGQNSFEHIIASLDRTTMGDYVCEVTNSVVPGLTLLTAPQTILAVTELSGRLFFESAAATKGAVTLFHVKTDGAYDTIRVNKVDAGGNFKFSKVVLGDYQLMGYPDIVTYPRALPTYFEKTTLWEEADTLFVDGSLSGLDIGSEVKPTAGPAGTGVIKGTVEEDDGLTGGRTMGKQKLGSAGVSARRVEGNGRTKEEILVLVAYVFTNANGEFEITNLPQDEYRLNIQYPGYPMDKTSFITIPIGTGVKSTVEVEATVADNKITVRQLAITGISESVSYKADVYPVPASETISIRFAAPSRTRSVEFTDLAGRTLFIRSANEEQLAINIQSIERGIYILNVLDKNDSVKKLRVVVK